MSRLQVAFMVVNKVATLVAAFETPWARFFSRNSVVVWSFSDEKTHRLEKQYNNNSQKVKKKGEKTERFRIQQNNNPTYKLSQELS